MQDRIESPNEQERRGLYKDLGVGVPAQLLAESAPGSTQQRELQHELRVRFGQAIDRVEQFLHTENDHGNFSHI